MSDKPLARFADIHHHGAVAPEMADSTMVCLSPTETTEVPSSGYYSVGIHPWDSDKYTAEMMDTVRRMAAAPNVVAIGESGLDALRGAPIDVQTDIFRQHALLAEQTGKPLIIHAVRTYNEIMDLHRQMRPTVQWIIHGFRGKPQLATQLTRHGIALSFGALYNPESYDLTPQHLRYHETD